MIHSKKPFPIYPIHQLMPEKLIKKDVYVYGWETSDFSTVDGDRCIVRCYGKDKENKNVMTTIEDFTPHIYVELPQEIKGEFYDWTDEKIRELSAQLTSGYDNTISRRKCSRMKKLYYAHKIMNEDFDETKPSGPGNLKYKDKKFPYLYYEFKSSKKLAYFHKKFEGPITFRGKSITFKTHEGRISPLVKLYARQQIYSSGWLTIEGFQSKKSEKESSFDLEIKASYKNIQNLTDNTMVNLKTMSIDGEMNSHNENAFPNKLHPKDACFQISAVISQNAKFSSNNVYKKYLISMRHPITKQYPNIEKLEKGTILIKAPMEKDVYIKLALLIKLENPNIVIGYNIYKFDIDYWLKRAEMTNVTNDLLNQSILKNELAKEGKAKWSSQAFGQQEMSFIDCAGRMYFDVYLFVLRNYKITDYRLSTVSEHFKVGAKDPLKPKDIFRKWAEGTPDSLGDVGKYCVQDSYVVTLLWEKLNIFVGISEEARTNCVPIIWLYTKGQQIRTVSQIYKKNHVTGTVVESEGYIPKEGEKYVGAFVIDPKVGRWKFVVPLDFASLYPSIIQANNLCYRTLLRDRIPKETNPLKRKKEIECIKHDQGVDIPDEECNIFEWSEHINCEHDEKKNLEIKKKRDKLEAREKKKRDKEKEKEEKRKLKLLKQTKGKREKADLEKTFKQDAKNMIDAVKKRRLNALKETIKDFDDDYGQQVKEKPKKIVKTVEDEKKQELVNDAKKALKIAVLEMPEGKTKKIICGSYRFRYLKAEFGGEGTLPELESDLLGARKKAKDEKAIFEGKIYEIEKSIEILKHIRKLADTRNLSAKQSSKDIEKFLKKLEIKDDKLQYYTEIYNKFLTNNKDEDDIIFKKWEIDMEEFSGFVVVFDKRQLAFKVSANSAYGMTGTTNGYLPMLPVAMTVTYVGRCGLLKVIKLAESPGFDGEVIYGDTDSVMVRCKHIKTFKELVAWGKRLADATLKIFPRPMKLEFENKIYVTFFILSKKRYASLVADKDGFVEEKITFKGIPLARRDNCRVLAEMYADTLLNGIFGLDKIKEENKIARKKYEVINTDNEKGSEKEEFKTITKKLIDYTDKLFTRQYKNKDFVIVKGISKEFGDYKTVPAVVHLAKRMEKRGIKLSVGSRIRYILTTMGGNKYNVKQSDKVEEEEYFEDNSEYLRVDYLYYMEKQCVKPIDQLLSLAFPDIPEAKNFMKTQFKFRKAKQALTNKIKEFGRPEIVLLN